MSDVRVVVKGSGVTAYIAPQTAPLKIAVLSQQGPQGPKGDTGSSGAAGSKITTGTGAPTAPGTGAGDLYVNVATGDLYQWSSSWSLVGNIRGPQGTTGNTGSAGAGVPTGGATGQLLAKLSNFDYDDHWIDPPTSAVWGAVTGTLSNQTDLQAALDAKAPTAHAVPAGGTTGQQLVKNSNTDYDTKWSAPSAVVAGSDTQIQYNSGGSLAGSAGLTFDATNKSLTVGGATVTTSNPVGNFSQTWNAGAVTFTGFRLNVTDTASAAASLLADLQVGGTSKFSVSKTGVLTTLAGTSSTPFTIGQGAHGIYQPAADNSWFGSHGGNVFWGLRYSDPARCFALGTALGWTSGNVTNTNADLLLQRGGAGILEQRNGTNAQTFRVANTWTSASVNEFGKLGFNSNVLEIGAEANGTGTLRPVKFIGASFTFANPDKAASFTVSTLPSASTSGAGTRAYATDLTSLTNGSTAAGSGSSKGTVVSNGTNWIVLG